MVILQSLVLPNLDVSAPEVMSVRLLDAAWSQLRPPCVHFAAGGLVSADTFYNGFSVGAWKRCCDLSSLQLQLRGEGRFVLRLGLHRERQASIWLDEQELSLGADETQPVPVPALAELGDGLLFWTLRALGPGRLDGASWVAPQPAAQMVRLAIVITHFNRQRQVLPAIARIERALAARADLAEHIDLTVVDNSSNLGLVSRPGLQVIPSRNFGGTGGFVRGLLAAMDSGRHTHALFMDDDASCETEAIARTWAMLSLARDARQAVCGALLREAAPWQMLEKGARWGGEVRPMHAGLNLCLVEHLLHADAPGAAPDYGAWWFFAFPLAEVRRFPFPFFVRGDDVQFGLDNRFQIATMNGVACLGDDFGLKHSPLTAYLDARYHLVLALLYDRRPQRRLSWIAQRLFVKSLCAYQYSSARAVTLALRHVLEGPDFFRRHIDLQAVRSEIAGWLPDEKLRPLQGLAGSEPTLALPRRREPVLRRLLRLMTLQGFLLPDALLRQRTLVQDKDFHGRASEVFRHRRVLYQHRPSGSGFLAEYDRGRFFEELRAFAPVAWRVRQQLGPLQAAYREAATEFGQAQFWRQVHGLAPAAAAAPSAAPASVRSMSDEADQVGTPEGVGVGVAPRSG